MSNSTSGIDAFGMITKISDDPTVKAGRYSSQKEAERLILGDILPKIQVLPTDRVLDIGCGSGLLTIGLASLVHQIVALDHVDVINGLEETISLPNVQLVDGAFPSDKVTGQFNVIIAYSVVQCLPNFEAVTSFVGSAMAQLAPGGRLLIGDLPNTDRKSRFRASETGQAFEKEWSAMQAQHTSLVGEAEAFAELVKGEMLGGFSDDQVLELVSLARKAGFDAWLMNQRPDLPFGNSREDLLIRRF